MVKSRCALVLPGAVAKGAYEAGVIDVIVEQDIPIDRIVATSSGALNGVAFALGIRSGHKKEMASRIIQAWVQGGGWHDALSINPLNFIRGKGLSDGKGLLKLLSQMVTPFPDSEKNEVELRIIVAPLKGILGRIGKIPATTYEKVFHFSNEDFDTPESLAKIFKVTTAACAFPGLFAPVELEDLGLCVDGGAVNNAPIGYALGESDVARIIMPIPFPAVSTENIPTHGLAMANHMIEILINERLYRDLRSAHVINEGVFALHKLVADGVIDSKQCEIIKNKLAIRNVDIIEVRPRGTVRGGAFSGFFNKGHRVELVKEGREAALEILTNVKINQTEAI